MIHIIVFINSFCQYLKSHRYQNAAVTLQDDSKVLVCFSDQLSYKRCQYFDGEKADLDDYEMTKTHSYGCVAHYNDKIIAIGDYNTSPYNHIELRDPSSKQWTRTTDHIYTNRNRFMACLAVSDGTITFGGSNTPTSVYLFKMEKWSFIGSLNSAHYYPAAIQYNDEIYTVGDSKNEFFIYDNTELVDYIEIEPSVLYTNNVASNQYYALILDSKYDSCI
ncbi:unnamed protein product [Oikopleura dioica]|uniref:Kelch-like protein n=1 Tax=Oikopleura dioica TaxID=34765 RepID=E4Y0X0_OIKDI|nr:unnamed protein product [Oikopleura dioica]